jgi:hypothetical protein
MAYGPLALGKGQYCPRDGRLDCSIVDALEASQLLGLATEPRLLFWKEAKFLQLLTV